MIYRVRDSAPDGSNPRVCGRLNSVVYRLKFVPNSSFFVLVQPMTLELLGVGRRFAAMEAEKTRLERESAELQGLSFIFRCFGLFLLLLFV